MAKSQSALVFVTCAQKWAENVVKNIASTKEWVKVLCALGRIMYSHVLPILSLLCGQNNKLSCWEQVSQMQFNSFDTSKITGCWRWLCSVLGIKTYRMQGKTQTPMWNHSTTTWKEYYIIQEKGSPSVKWIGWFTT